MSSSIFAKLTRDDPNCRDVAHYLDEWLDTQPEEFSHEFLVSWPARSLSSKVSAAELARVVQILSKSPDVKILYRIEDPEGNVVGREYDDIRKVPLETYDLSGNVFNVELENIQQVIRFQ